MINLIKKRKWLSFFIIFLLVVPDILHSKELSSHRSSPKNAHKRISQVESYQLQQVASFKIQKNAERFVKKLKSEGQEALIKKRITKDKKVIYRVFVKEYKAPSKNIPFQDSLKREADIEKTPIKKEDSVIKTSSKKHTESSKDASSAGEMNQISSFKIFNSAEDAENFAKELRTEGYETVLRRDITKDSNIVYAVFAEKNNEQSKDILSSGGVKYEAPLETALIEEKTIKEEKQSLELREQPKDMVSPTEVKQKTTPEKTSLGEQPVGEKSLAMEQKESSKVTPPSSEIKHETTLVKQSEEDKPIGTARGRTTESVFGTRGGFVHPFLSITEYYTDNVFYSNDNKKSDFVTVISPGIWLTVPHVHEKLLQIDTTSMSPGGFSLSKYNPETFRRYQTYLFYNADIERFSKYPSEDTVNHKAEGLFQYNLRGGLSISLLDQFIASHDDRGSGISDKLDKYKTNLANVIVTYDVTERLQFRGDYSNFLVNYLAKRNNFRDRDDNAFSGYIFYKIRPKTALFIEYDFVNIDYKEDNSFNSREHHYFGGFQWDITAKSKGTVKAGYGTKDFKAPSLKTVNYFALEAQIDYKFTPKTSLIVKASRKTNETNISTTDYILSNTIEVEYLQRLTGKITADVKFSYTHDNYKGAVTLDGVTQEIKDNYYIGAFAFQYNFKEWLHLDLGYIYDKRDSNFEEVDYTTNIVFLRLMGTL